MGVVNCCVGSLFWLCTLMVGVVNYCVRFLIWALRPCDEDCELLYWFFYLALRLCAGVDVVGFGLVLRCFVESVLLVHLIIFVA